MVFNYKNGGHKRGRESERRLQGPSLTLQKSCRVRRQGRMKGRRGLGKREGRIEEGKKLGRREGRKDGETEGEFPKKTFHWNLFTQK